MNIGEYEVADLRHAGELWGRISNVIGVAVHHTVSDEDISAANDRDAIAAVLQYHRHTMGWPGIGYHLMIGDDGTIYYVGDLAQQRAHVYARNHELWGVSLLGNYTHVLPPPAQIAGCAKAVVALRQHSGSRALAWKGHCEWAVPESPTSCPGDRWPDYRDELAEAIRLEENPVVKTLTREQAVNIWKAQRVKVDEVWAYVFAIMGWPTPPELA